ncbi:hypothetical protein PF007_g24635 [Phytophthora fragariae]|uniref:ZSWIM1/3 RNaseH-like domain-containing protein n=1 Tax=Phytophthora fragariae TaxID=53985 RepID=A0A6A3QIT0_9STRA|nr:hypothetical protein PF011_g20953 [Phytophthora fragariae]KAE9076410.1 hypothetical protein PF007_g24635 [Phytophthora fragariae]KAE9315610.1 hypothetical protein PF008_g19201 [Phytophthora fragariae]
MLQIRRARTCDSDNEAPVTLKNEVGPACEHGIVLSDERQARTLEQKAVLLLPIPVERPMASRLFLGMILLMLLIEIKTVDGWVELEGYLRNYSKRTYKIFLIRTEVQFYKKPTFVRTTERAGEREGDTKTLEKNWLPSSDNCLRSRNERLFSLQVFIAGQKTGHNHERIFEYISVNASVDPKKKNVHNLLSRLRREAYAFPTIEECIRAILEDFPSKPGIVTRVYANDEGVVEALTIQSSHVRTMFHHFPGILHIDTTHDTNSLNYKLYSFMIHDDIGEGQYAVSLLDYCFAFGLQHSLIENERNETLRFH